MSLKLKEEIFHFTEKQLAKSPGVIEDVVVCGPTSKNGRRYTEQYFDSAISKYEGSKVFLNHVSRNSNSGSRSMEGYFGRLTGVYHDKNAKKLKARRFEYNPKHLLAEQIEWQMANQPESCGFSHDVIATGKEIKGVYHVESCRHVYSVDLVVDPATTKSLKESLERMPHVLTEDGPMGIPEPGTEPSKEETAALREIISKMVYNNKPETQKKKDSDDMEWDEITEETLRRKRPDIATLLESSAKNREEALKTQERLNLLEAENRALKEEKDKAKHAERILELCEEHKLPKNLRSKFFMRQLENVTDEKEIVEAIVDRRTLAGNIKPVQAKSREIEEEVNDPANDSIQESTVKGGLEAMDTKAFARSIFS